MTPEAVDLNEARRWRRSRRRTEGGPRKTRGGEGEGQREATFTLSDSDDSDEPVAQVTQAGATADPVKDYLQQIGKVPLLNAEQEVELAKRIEAGLFAEEKLAENPDLDTETRIKLEWIAEDGRRAKNHLLEANLRLVVSLAKRYTGRGMLFLDLIKRATSVSSVQWRSSTTPRGTRILHLRRGGSGRRSRVPWPIRPARSTFRCTWSRSSTDSPACSGRCCRISGREPTPEELAAELDAHRPRTRSSRCEVRPASRSRCPRRSVRTATARFGDLIEDSRRSCRLDAVSFTLLQEQLESVLDTLSSARPVVRMRFGLSDGQPKTRDEIGKVYGVTRERIRQIESKTMSKLHHPSRSQALRDYLD